MVSLGEGFGVNTNILETNILNLAVVIGVVISLGKDVLSSILETRREKILSSLRTADERFKAAQEELSAAKAELASAKEKVGEIQNEGRKTIETITAEGTKRCDAAVQRFSTLKDETLRFEEEKAVREVRQRLISFAFEKATKTIQSRMNAQLHRQCIDLNIALMDRAL